MEKAFRQFGKNMKEFGRPFLIAIVDSRLQPGFNLPIKEDGRSLKDIGLEGLGVKRNEQTGELEDIPPVEPKT